MEEELESIDPRIPKGSTFSHINDIVIREKVAKEEPRGAVIINPAHGRAPEHRWNRPQRFLVIYLLAFLKLSGSPTIEDIKIWMDREKDWKKENIPAQVSDRSFLRLQVWKANLPNPQLHIQQITIRMPWLFENLGIPRFTHWFLRVCRGAPEIDQSTDTDRVRRCQLCGSCIFGYPVANHHWKDCFFRRLGRIPKIRFMSVNMQAFCASCGSMSRTHTDADCREAGPRHCGGCGQPGHQTFQELCRGDPINQNQVASESQRDHYLTCRRLATEGRLMYPCPGDYPSDVTRSMLQIRRNNGDYPMVVGWGQFFEHFAREFGTITLANYTMRRSFKGLTSPEHNSANVNSNLILPPEDMDRAAMFGMIVDFHRFKDHTVRGRRGNEPVFVLPEHVGQRKRLRQSPVAQATPEPTAGPAPLPNRAPYPKGMETRRQNQGPVITFPDSGSNTPPPEREIQAFNTDDFSDDGWNMSKDSVDETKVPEPETKKPVTKSQTEEKPDGRKTAANSGSPKGRSVQSEKGSVNPQGSSKESASPRPDKVEIEPTFDRSKFSQWFFFIKREAMPEQQECNIERRFNNDCWRNCRVHKDTRKVLTNGSTLDAIVKRPIPNHRSTLKLRVNFLYASLTGQGIPREWDDDCDTLTVAQLQDYVTLIQGAHRLLQMLSEIQKAIPVSVTNCRKLLWAHLHDHCLALPDPMTFVWDVPDQWFSFCNEDWWSIFDGVQRETCSCLLIPRK